MTTTVTINIVRYPIGPFKPSIIDSRERARLIEQLSLAPDQLRHAVFGLLPEILDTPYRAGGWTIAQVVHHLADSHVNAYVRFKLALTEEEPLVKVWDENLWANLSDASSNQIDSSLLLFESLHERWVDCLHSLPEENFSRTLKHPERGVMTVDDLLALYAWHARHHIAHITSFRQREL